MKNTKNAGDFIFGRNSVTEALKLCPQRINKIIILKSVTNDPKINEIVTLARQNRVVFQFVPKERFANFTEFSHQGIAAYTSPVSYLDIDDFWTAKNKKQVIQKLLSLTGWKTLTMWVQSSEHQPVPDTMR